MSNLENVARASRVHQILLAHGEVDKIPEDRIADVKSKLHGEHRLWLEEDIVQLLVDNYPPKVHEAYKSIKPLAYKADLARYCILHTYGGWYIDLFVTLGDLKVLQHFSRDTEAILFREMLVPPGGSLLSILNTIFWFKDPGHEVLENLINVVASNILNKEYGVHPFSVTGSLPFGREVAAYEMEKGTLPFLIGECSMVDGTPTHQISFVIEDNPLVISTRRKIEEDISDEVPLGYEKHPNNYYKKWLDRDIFN